MCSATFINGRLSSCGFNSVLLSIMFLISLESNSFWSRMVLLLSPRGLLAMSQGCFGNTTGEAGGIEWIEARDAADIQQRMLCPQCQWCLGWEALLGKNKCFTMPEWGCSLVLAIATPKLISEVDWRRQRHGCQKVIQSAAGLQERSDQKQDKSRRRDGDCSGLLRLSRSSSGFKEGRAFGRGNTQGFFFPRAFTFSCNRL